MKVEQGYVAATPAGSFMVWYERHTHTGRHIYFTLVTDIEKATFSFTPQHWPRADRAPEHTWVPVERRTEIELKGYGT